MAQQFSIITVSLNDRENLLRTLASLDAQDFKDFEHIVIDGASTDGTLAILDERKNQHPHFSFLSEKDSGIYNAMNKGIRRSQGEYLYFLNAGDLLSGPAALRSVHEAIKGEDFIYTDIYLATDAGYVHRKYPNKLNVKFWLTQHLCHQATFFKKALFDRLGLYDESFKIAADHEFFLRAQRKGNASMRHVPFPVAVYRMDGVSSRKDIHREIVAEIARGQRLHLMTLTSKLVGARLLLPRFVAGIRNFYLQRFLKILTAPFGTRLRPEEQVLDLFYENLEKSKLKVLHLNTYESTGGAAIAAHRLHRALRREQVDSRMLVLHRSSSDPTVYQTWPRYGWARLAEAFKFLFEKLLRKIAVGGQKRWGLSSFAIESYADIQSAIDIHDPDVVHLHWTCDRFISIEELGRIKMPIVWSFHDMWAFCGAEHVSYDSRYVEGYSEKNSHLAGARFDLDRWVWNRKKKSFPKLQDSATVVAPSRWMKETVKTSALFKNFQVECIPNGLDTEMFSPRAKLDSRKSLGIDTVAKVILFGAVDISADPNKGVGLLVEAFKELKMLRPAENFLLLAFGHFHPDNASSIPYEVKSLGYFSSPGALAALYASADVFVVSSKLESFGQSASESMACGTPVVCFDSTGLKDIVDHKENGYLAKCFDPVDLAAGISWVFDDPERRKSLSEKARLKVLDKFSDQKVAKQFIEVYQRAKS